MFPRSNTSARFLCQPKFFKTLLGICATLLLTACGAVTPAPTATRPAPTAMPSPTVSPDCAPGSHNNELLSGGETRLYILHIPPSYTPKKPVALVFGFHGNNGQAGQFESYSGFSILADREGFIVAYPQGSGEHPSWEAWQGGKDVQFVRDLIAKLATICNIDPARIYATGHSLGGGMVNRLACDLSERIAAIGPVSGAYQDGVHCSPSRPVAIAAVHGTGDSVIYYNGFGVNGSSPAAYFTVGTPIPQWASAWAQRNGCNAKAETFFQKGPVSGQQWVNCRSKADVVLYTIRDGEHGWPTPDANFDVAQTLWDFFEQHPLPSASNH